MQPRSFMSALFLGALFTLPSTVVREPTQYLPVYGGSGGTTFTRDCGPGRVLTGLRGRNAMLVDAVGLLCRPVNANGTLGQESTVGALAGGGGGTVVVASCDANMVVTGAKILYGTYLDRVWLECSSWIASTRSWAYPNFTMSNSLGRAGIDGSHIEVQSRCGSKFQPASGIRGRAGGFVDAFGFVCDEP